MFSLRENGLPPRSPFGRAVGKNGPPLPLPSVGVEG